MWSLLSKPLETALKPQTIVKQVWNREKRWQLVSPCLTGQPRVWIQVYHFTPSFTRLTKISLRLNLRHSTLKNAAQDLDKKVEMSIIVKKGKLSLGSFIKTKNCFSLKQEILIFFIVFAFGGSPTSHPISSRPHFVCKF
jgi:hypothetical protein